MEREGRSTNVMKERSGWRRMVRKGESIIGIIVDLVVVVISVLTET